MHRPAPSPVGSLSGTTPAVRTRPSKRYLPASSARRERHEATHRPCLSKRISRLFTPPSADSFIAGSPLSDCGCQPVILTVAPAASLGGGGGGSTPSCFSTARTRAMRRLRKSAWAPSCCCACCLPISSSTGRMRWCACQMVLVRNSTDQAFVSNWRARARYICCACGICMRPEVTRPPKPSSIAKLGSPNIWSMPEAMKTSLPDAAGT